SLDSGEYGDLVRRAIEEARSGNCSREVMSDVLATACRKQVSTWRDRFDKLGGIRKVTVQGTVPTEGGTAEIYEVVFERGTMNWYANVDTSRRLYVFFCPASLSPACEI